MRKEHFIQWCEAYYGQPYNKVQKAEIIDYLSRFGEEYIEELKNAVRDNISPMYKTLPGVADFEKLAYGIRQRALPPNTSIFQKGQKLIEERPLSKAEAKKRFREMREKIGMVAAEKRWEG